MNKLRYGDTIRYKNINKTSINESNIIGMVESIHDVEKEVKEINIHEINNNVVIFLENQEWIFGNQLLMHISS